MWVLVGVEGSCLEALSPASLLPLARLTPIWKLRQLLPGWLRGVWGPSPERVCLVPVGHRGGGRRRVAREGCRGLAPRGLPRWEGAAG